MSASQALTGESTPAPALAPYAVMVLSRSGGTAGFCSASVLAPDIVLTAAHCVTTPADTRVHFKTDAGAPVLIEVSAIAKHPRYRADAPRTREISIDLALLRLAKPLPAGFTPIALAQPQDIKQGEMFRIAGFGVTHEDAPQTSGSLRVATIAVRGPLSRILLWAHDPQGKDTGACTGDSGGPILAPDPPVQVAVTAWSEGRGQRKCGALTQGVLVAPQRAWIDGVMAEWRGR